MTTSGHVTARPPRWAESVLRLLLPFEHRDSVSGDLLEEYRDAIVPARGKPAADRWYSRQVAGFAWRATWVWALLFSGAFVGRTGYDWFVSRRPTSPCALQFTTTRYFAIMAGSSSEFGSVAIGIVRSRARWSLP